MILNILVTALVIGSQKGGPPPSPWAKTHTEEPGWSKSALTQNHPELTAVRKSIQKTYGLIPESSFVKVSAAEAALKVYERSHDPVDAFKTLYLLVATNDSSNYFQADKKYEALWSDLPQDDYEVARLHLMWGLAHVENILKPLGNRLLAKNKDDAELLWQLAYDYSHFGPDSDRAIGIDFAERAAKLVPCPRTYLGCADAHAAILWVRKNGDDADIAMRYLDKYFAVAPKDDPAQGWAKKSYTVLKTHKY